MQAFLQMEGQESQQLTLLRNCCDVFANFFSHCASYHDTIWLCACHMEDDMTIWLNCDNFVDIIV